MLVTWPPSNPTCTRDTCGHVKRLEVDHRIDWADTHHTVLGELDLEPIILPPWDPMGDLAT